MSKSNLTATKAIAGLKAKLAKSAADAGGSVPPGQLQHFAAKPIGNGGFVAIGIYRPAKRSYKGKVPTGGYARRFYSMAVAHGVSPANCKLPDAHKLTLNLDEAHMLEGFDGGGWQYAAQMACRHGAATGNVAVSYGVYAIAATGTATLVEVGVANTLDDGKVRATMRANRLFGAAFERGTSDHGVSTNPAPCQPADNDNESAE